MTAVGGWSEVVGGAGSEATAAETVGEGLGRGPAADEAARSGVVQGSAVVVCEELGSVGPGGGESDSSGAGVGAGPRGVGGGDVRGGASSVSGGGLVGGCVLYKHGIV